MELTDAQWEVLKPLLAPKTPSKRRGRPWADTRSVFEGVLWILRTGAQWSNYLAIGFRRTRPAIAASSNGCARATLARALRVLAEDLLARGQLDLAETFVDATFAGAKKGAVLLVQHAAAKGPRSWQLRSAMVFLSPWGLEALRHMKLVSSKPRRAAVHGGGGTNDRGSSI